MRLDFLDFSGKNRENHFSYRECSLPLKPAVELAVARLDCDPGKSGEKNSDGISMSNWQKKCARRGKSKGSSIKRWGCLPLAPAPWKLRKSLS
jgi:hypothetical protein